jgi:hypothetical protein
MGRGQRTQATAAANRQLQSTLEHALDRADTELMPELPELLHRYARHYGQPELGRTRAVFARNEGWVVKVPLDDEGLAGNGHEANWSAHDLIPLAECHLVEDSTGGIQVLHMRRVEPEHISYADGPDWLGLVDCGQVGRDRDGRLVAYDL